MFFHSASVSTFSGLLKDNFESFLGPIWCIAMLIWCTVHYFTMYFTLHCSDDIFGALFLLEMCLAIQCNAIFGALFFLELMAVQPGGNTVKLRLSATLLPKNLLSTSFTRTIKNSPQNPKVNWEYLTSKVKILFTTQVLHTVVMPLRGKCCILQVFICDTRMVGCGTWVVLGSRGSTTFTENKIFSSKSQKLNFKSVVHDSGVVSVRGKCRILQVFICDTRIVGCGW